MQSTAKEELSTVETSEKKSWMTDDIRQLFQARKTEIDSGSWNRVKEITKTVKKK